MRFYRPVATGLPEPGAIAQYFTKGYAGSQPDTVSFSNYEFYGNDRIVTEVSDADIRDPEWKAQISR